MHVSSHKEGTQEPIFPTVTSDHTYRIPPKHFFPVVFTDTTIPEPVHLRLMNGSNRCTGRVEVLHDKQWGTVCDNSWDLTDAEVVCKQLGCGTALSALLEAHFGEGSEHIWLDDVNCNGTETALTECKARPWGNNSCHHGKDAGVVCSGIPHPPCFPRYCKKQTGKFPSHSLLFLMEAMLTPATRAVQRHFNKEQPTLQSVLILDPSFLKAFPSGKLGGVGGGIHSCRSVSSVSDDPVQS